MPLLALDAARRPRKRLQPFEADIAAAVDADAVGAILDALARRFQRAEFFQIARHVRLLEVGEERGDRFVAGIRRRAGVLGIGMLARARGILAQFGKQRFAALVDSPLQFLGLSLGQRHRNLHVQLVEPLLAIVVPHVFTG